MSSSIDDHPVFEKLKEFNVPSAAYNFLKSAKRCDDDTRLDVIGDIMDWADGKRGPQRICWLHGHAGLGKSAIAHTIARKLDARESPGEKRLLGTFVFSRSAEEARRTTDRLFPTLAYQLAISIPKSQDILLKALRDDREIPKQLLEIQFKRLFLEPVKPFAEASDRLLVVIDGLDECHEDGAIKFIDLLVQHSSSLPVRFLLTSRKEQHIHGAFNKGGLAESGRTLPIDLLGYNATNDIRKFLEAKLSALYEERPEYMRHVKKPWPPKAILEEIVQKTQGVFQYASTLAEFVRQPPGGPDGKLRSAAKEHPGLDSLYKQVLRVAQRNSTDDFERILGALLSLRRPISLKALSYLLDFPSTTHIWDGLWGCESILLIPTDQDKPIRFYHASLRDFLMDKGRSGGEGAHGFFIEPIEHHVNMLNHCMQVITNEFESGSMDKLRSSSGGTNEEVELQATFDTDSSKSTNREVQSDAANKDEESTPGNSKEDVDLEGMEDAVQYAWRNWQYHMMNVFRAETGLTHRPSSLDSLTQLTEIVARIETECFEGFNDLCNPLVLDVDDLIAVALIVKDDLLRSEFFKPLCRIVVKIEDFNRDRLRRELRDHRIRDKFHGFRAFSALRELRFNHLWKDRWARLGLSERGVSPLQTISALKETSPQPATPFEPTTVLQPVSYQLATWHHPSSSQTLPS